MAPENLNVPPVQPVVVGVKLTVRLTLWPGANIRGRFTEGVVNSELPPVIPEIVTLDAPLFVTVTGRVLVSPTTTAPNGRFSGVQATCPTRAPALMGAIPRSKIATADVSKLTCKLTERIKSEWMMDWGSRMPSSLKGLGLREKMSAVHQAGGPPNTKPMADRTSCQLADRPMTQSARWERVLGGAVLTTLSWILAIVVWLVWGGRETNVRTWQGGPAVWPRRGNVPVQSVG